MNLYIRFILLYPKTLAHLQATLPWESIACRETATEANSVCQPRTQQLQDSQHAHTTQILGLRNQDILLAVIYVPSRN